jgi:hypothetical protein
MPFNLYGKTPECYYIFVTLRGGGGGVGVGGGGGGTEQFGCVP